MARRIAWLVAATTSAVVMAFIVPLCFLVANIAEDKATTEARVRAHYVATLLATIDDTAFISSTVADLSSSGPEVVVVEEDGQLLGPQDELGPRREAAAKKAFAQPAAFTDRHEDGFDAVVTVSTQQRGLEVVIASVPTSQLRAGVWAAWAAIIGLGIGLVALSVAVALWLGRRTSIPVTEVAEVAHRLREGDSTARAVPGGPPETAELGRALNALADRIHGLVVAEREHVADLGHRLRTPVTALRLDTDLVEDDDVAARLRGHVEDLQRSIDDVVHEARRAVRDELPATCRVAPVVTDRVAFWLPLAEDQGRRLDLFVEVRTPAGSPFVGLAAEDLSELLDILLDNVFAHTPDGTDARVRVRHAGDEVVVIVEDAGSGMEQPYLGRGHSQGGSTGLGLAIVHRIADGAGGSVQLEPSALGGLRVTVHLPVRPDESRPRRGATAGKR